MEPSDKKIINQNQITINYKQLPMRIIYFGKNKKKDYVLRKNRDEDGIFLNIKEM